MSEERIRCWNIGCIGHLQPDLTFLVRCTRCRSLANGWKKAPPNPDKFEREQSEFFERVSRDAYLRRCHAVSAADQGYRFGARRSRSFRRISHRMLERCEYRHPSLASRNAAGLARARATIAACTTDLWPPRHRQSRICAHASRSHLLCESRPNRGHCLRQVSGVSLVQRAQSSGLSRADCPKRWVKTKTDGETG